MKGILKCVTKSDEEKVKYIASNDVDGDMNRFQYRKQHPTKENRGKYIQNTEIEVVEITDNLNERYAYYVLPQSDKIEYDSSIIENILDKKTKRRLQKAIDWTLVHFSDEYYSYIFSVYIDDELKGIEALVNKDGKKFETYIFGNSKEPIERIAFE